MDKENRLYKLFQGSDTAVWAHDEIIRQQKRIAELEQAQPKWISADDELPKESGRFWCYVKCVGDLCFYFEQDNCSYNLQEKRWNSEVWGGRSEFVTHWMPLPQPPEVKP